MVNTTPTSLTLALVVVLGSVPLFASGQRRPAIVTRASLIDRLSAPDAQPLVQYRALRHLTAATRGGRMTASLDALTTFDGSRFAFEVQAEDGSPLILRKVLLAALQAEQESQSAVVRDQAALSAANYEFLELSAAPEQLMRLNIRPRRHHVMLVDGALFFEDESADLVRVDGELSKRPSFWTRRVHITREYQRIDGVHVPISMRSTASVVVAGESTFSMTYRYLEINGRTVAP